MHLCDDDLRNVLDRIHHASAHFKQRTSLRKFDIDHVAKVVTGRKHRAICFEDDSEGIRGTDLVKSGLHLKHELTRQRVTSFWAVQRDGDDITFTRHKKVGC